MVIAGVVALGSLAVAIGAVAWARSEVASVRRVGASSPLAEEVSAEPVSAPSAEPASAPTAERAAALEPPQAAVVDPAQAAVVEPAQAAIVEPAQAAVVEPARTDAASARSQPARESRRAVHQVRYLTALKVVSEPPGVEVMLDGRRLGTTPFVTMVDRNEETTLWFHGRGMMSDWRRVKPKSATSTVHITMQPKRK